MDNHWTDYLPIILPTEERVAAMLAGTSHKPDEVVGRMRPANFREFWEYTVEKVAVNAVMAGAKPEHFPVILALAASGVSARSSSTTSMANIAVVNGPIRDEIGMNSGIGVLGPYNHANAAIGRAYNLLSQNLQGGSVPGESYMGSMGNPLNYTACFAEAEERSPWAPLHVQKGMKAEESAVTIFFGGWYIASGFGPRETWKEQLHRALVTFNFIPPFLVMDPICARYFKELGFDTKEKLIAVAVGKLDCRRRANIGTSSGSRRCTSRWRSPGSSRSPPASRRSPTSSSAFSSPATSTSSLPAARRRAPGR